MEKLYRAHVTPRDAIDCNQLVSLLQGLTASKQGERFKVGQRCLIWLNIDRYSTHIDLGGRREGGYWSSPTISINELAKQLQLWAIE